MLPYSPLYIVLPVRLKNSSSRLQKWQQDYQQNYCFLHITWTQLAKNSYTMCFNTKNTKNTGYPLLKPSQTHYQWYPQYPYFVIACMHTTICYSQYRYSNTLATSDTLIPSYPCYQRYQNTLATRDTIIPLLYARIQEYPHCQWYQNTLAMIPEYHCYQWIPLLPYQNTSDTRIRIYHWYTLAIPVILEYHCYQWYQNTINTLAIYQWYWKLRYPDILVTL